MANKRVTEVFNSYKNIRQFLLANIDNLLVEKCKSRCKISRRRLDFITDINTLISMLEKLGDLDAFNIQSIEIIICSVLTDGPVKKKLQNFICTRRTLIDKCDNVVLPVYNQYAEEILNGRQESSGWNNLGRNFDVPNTIGRSKDSRTTGRNLEFSYPKQENSSNTKQRDNNDICDQFSEVIELIADEIGVKWQEFARYLGLTDAEIDEIVYDQNIWKLREKSRKALTILLQRINNASDAKETILEGLSKVRRNDLKRRVNSMI